MSSVCLRVTYCFATAVLGTAFAFNILLKIPVWAGVILTVFSTLLLLGVQRFGVHNMILFSEHQHGYHNIHTGNNLLMAWPNYVHHTGPQIGVHYSGFHVHHGGLLLWRVELPEATCKGGCQGHVCPLTPGKGCCC